MFLNFALGPDSILKCGGSDRSPLVVADLMCGSGRCSLALCICMCSGSHNAHRMQLGLPHPREKAMRAGRVKKKQRVVARVHTLLAKEAAYGIIWMTLGRRGNSRTPALLDTDTDETQSLWNRRSGDAFV